MRFLYSKNNKIGSRLISWAARFENLSYKEDKPSHVALLLDNGLVIESTFKEGVRIVPFEAWSKINQTIMSIKLDVPDTLLYKETYGLWGKKYDWAGIIYFAICYLGLILFKRPLPHKNKWQTSNKYMCTELVGKLTDTPYHMVSPAKMLELMLEKK